MHNDSDCHTSKSCFKSDIGTSCGLEYLKKIVGTLGHLHARNKLFCCYFRWNCVGYTYLGVISWPKTPCSEISLNMNLNLTLTSYRFCFSRHVFPPDSVAQIIGPSAIYIGFTFHAPPWGVLALVGETANFEESTNGVSVFVLKMAGEETVRSTSCHPQALLSLNRLTCTFARPFRRY